MVTVHECFSCHETKPCQSLTMGINGAGAVSAVTGTKEGNFFKTLDTFYICPACVQSKSTKNANALWIWYTILLIISYIVYAVFLPRVALNAEFITLAAISFFAKLSIGMILVMQSGFSVGKKVLFLFLQFSPIVGDVALFSQKKKIDMNRKSVDVLKPLVTQYYT